jgi:hypothetical protein
VTRASCLDASMARDWLLMARSSCEVGCSCWQEVTDGELTDLLLTSCHVARTHDTRYKIHDTRCALTCLATCALTCLLLLALVDRTS